MGRTGSGTRRILRAIGPGVITGAADDDPSGIATYSIAGAQFGTALLWTALLTWPMMAAVQMVCARIGLVTGRGLAATLKQSFPKWLLVIFVCALLIANTINIAADLAGMSDAAQMLTGISSRWFIAIFVVIISWTTVKLPYRRFADVLKWLVVVLFAYPITAFIVRVNWIEVARSTLLPSLPHSRAEWSTLVAILGTTISPYLFFWQTSAEIEEEIDAGQKTLKQRKGATTEEISASRIDVTLGTLFSNVVMFFIIVTTAATLNKHGITHIATTHDAAEALRPLAGRFAALLFTVGVVGVGLLAIPTLAGSAAYAFADTFKWKQGLGRTFDRARAFYSVILLSTIVAAVLTFTHLDPVRALYWSAVINGLLSPFVLVTILIVAIDSKLMNGQPASAIGWVAVAFTTAAMFVAGVAMFVV
jgi:NRAMP (natural resistance-associated macrophage protein)-like metal ion transporter